MEYISNFEDFKLNENKETYTVYNEQSLMRTIKNVFNNHYRSSIKDITVSITDKKIVYWSKYRKGYNLKSEEKPYKEVKEGDEFIPFLTKIMEHVWDNPRIEFDKYASPNSTPIIYVYHT